MQDSNDEARMKAAGMEQWQGLVQGVCEAVYINVVREVRAQAQGVGSGSAMDGNTYAAMNARPGARMKRVRANTIQSKGS